MYLFSYFPWLCQLYSLLFSEPASYISSSLLDRCSWIMHQHLKLTYSEWCFLLPLKTCPLSVLSMSVNGTIIHPVSKLTRTHGNPWISLILSFLSLPTSSLSPGLIESLHTWPHPFISTAILSKANSISCLD